jgi:hypothetical protein
MKKMSEKLTFVSRHKANDGQVALAKTMGYSGINQIEVQFGENPIEDLKEAGIEKKELAIVCPTYVSNILLNHGYTLIEFVNSPVKREKMVFCCEGAYKYKLKPAISMELVRYDVYEGIEQEFIECPIPIEEQYESSLV